MLLQGWRRDNVANNKICSLDVPAAHPPVWPSPPQPSITLLSTTPLLHLWWSGATALYAALHTRNVARYRPDTHTHTEENNSPKTGPYSQCVNVQKRFFKASHKQYCCLNRTELLSGALWDVGGVMMWVVGEGLGGLIQYYSDFYDTLLWSTFKNSIQLLCLSVVFQFCHNKGSLIL